MGQVGRRVGQGGCRAGAERVQCGCSAGADLRREAAQVRVLDEAARLGAVVILGKVRQGPIEEAVRDALTLDVLLADAGDHL